jgi:hypothetical protein
MRCRALQDCPEVQRAVYLSWQPGARIYGHEGSAQHFPPGQGDPALASDQLLFEHLVEAGRLDLAQSVNSTAGCRADCVERPSAMAGVRSGPAAGQAGLLLVEVREGVSLDWLGWVQDLLTTLLTSVNGMLRGRRCWAMIRNRACCSMHRADRWSSTRRYWPCLPKSR